MANIGNIANNESALSVRTKLNEAIAEANKVDDKLDTSSYTAADVKTKYESNSDTNAFTDAEKSKLTGIEAGADAYGGWTLTIDGVSQGTILSTESVDFVGGTNVTLAYSATGNVITISATDTDTTYTAGAGLTLTAAEFALAGESYTSAEQAKLSGIESGAQVNVNADWNASTGDAQILNKPALGTAASADSGDFATSAQGTLADSAVQPGDAVGVPHVVVSSSKTLALTDANTEQQVDAAATLTIPTNGAIAFERGTKIAALSITTGTVTITASAGVTLNGVADGSANLISQYSAAVITKVGTDTWVINGDHGGVA